VTIDPRLARALERQLAAWRAELDAGAERVGWKLGMGEAERIGRDQVVGHLTSATQLGDGDVFHGNSVDLRADAELAVVIGSDGEIDGYAAALELVDLGTTDNPEEIVATNVFHRAFALGPFQASFPRGGDARLIVNGDMRDAGPIPSVADRIHAAATTLAAMGERVEPGDCMITGSVVQVRVEAGDHVVGDFGALGAVRLRIAAAT
jgi:2-keto-4-pentenoate hydratase